MSECKPYIPSRVFENPTSKCEICEQPDLKIKHLPKKQILKKHICINDYVIRILGYLILIYILTKLLLQ